MKYIIISLLLTYLMNFSLNASENEFDTRLFRKHFTEQERLELSKILTFVDSIVLSHNEFTEIEKAYQNYYDSICRTCDSAFVDYLFVDEEKKFRFLFGLDTQLFEKIWQKYIPKTVNTMDTILYSPQNYICIDINTNGEYIKLLKDLGRTKKYYKNVYESISRTGGLSPTIYASFLDHQYRFDFNNIYDRLWFSIVLLTLEEPLEKKVERYLK